MSFLVPPSARIKPQHDGSLNRSTALRVRKPARGLLQDGPSLSDGTDRLGAPMDGAAGEETLPELAQDLIMELEETIARLQGWVKRIEPLDARAARD